MKQLSNQEVLYLRDALARCAEDDQNRLDNEAGDLSSEEEGTLRQRSRLCAELQSLIEESTDGFSIQIPAL